VAERKARPHVEPLARELEASITAPLDVSRPGQLESLFALVGERWGKLDIMVHSIAFAPKEDLQGGLLNCSAEGFAKAISVALRISMAPIFPIPRKWSR
jgi:enoyl-[acyl-carrier protein] reductase I